MISVLRLEAAGVVRARWLAAAIAVSVGTVLFFWGLAARESSILAFTGYSRVVTGTGLAALLVLPLLALFATTQAVTTAKTQGVLEWYLSHPVSRSGVFWSLFLPRVAAVSGPVAVAVVLLGAVAALSGQPIDPSLLGRLLGWLLGQGFCFAALGLWVSIASPSPEQALLRGLGIWLASAALVDFALIGAMLQWNLPPRAVFLLGALNPVQAGRLGLLSADGADLGVLGPVGTWLSGALGPHLTLAYGLGWPVAVGLLALGAAWRRFSRGDVI
jgi:ABC-type transport system involved in multi-copper enzyme maturation permease subunit